MSHKTASCISGGKFATLIHLTPMPAMSTLTMDSSPLSCLYSCCPCMFWSVDCILLAETNLYIPTREDHLSESFRCCLLVDAVVHISIHGCCRQLSLCACQSCRRSCCVVLQFFTRWSQTILNSLTCALQGM